MFEFIIDIAFSVLLIAGLPALFLVFVLKGALVGKVLPTSVFLPGYVFAVSPSELELIAIVLISSLGYAVGQLLVYYGARRKGVAFLRSAPRVRLSEARLRRSEALFERYGGPAIFITNMIPYLGGLALIPAGVASYSVRGVLVYALSSTVIYHAALVAVAVGAVDLLL
jgi:membrane protein DedA with SNARE-associated domain